MEKREIPVAKKGIGRAMRAAKFSWQGFKEIVKEDAFKQELIVTVVLTPVALFMPVAAIYKLLMIVSLLFVMLIEVLNTSIEAVVDLVSPDYHELAKLSKDLGSLAVLIAIVIAVAVWGVAVWKISL